MIGVVKNDPRLDIFTEAFDVQERGDIKRAIWLNRLLARKGWASAWTHLGDIFDDVVKPRRPREAVRCYMRAIKKREVSGANNLAVHSVG